MYLLYTTSFVTLEEVKNYKSLQSYKYFTAGLSETCSHVGALLYWMEYKVRTQEEQSSTSGPNPWLEPKPVRQVPYLELGNIDFTSAEKTMKKCHFDIHTEQESLPAEATTTSSRIEPDREDVVQLFEKCALSDSTLPILFSVEDEPYCNSFKKSATHLPLALQSLFKPEYLDCNYMELVEAGENMTGLLEVTPVQQTHLEQITRGQASSKVWMKYRSGRITASRFYQAVHTDPHKPAISLIHAICYPESVKFKTAATEYGCEHEKMAVNTYKLKQIKHQEMKITPAGLVLFLEKACFGASPDAFVECLCCGPGVLEVKCPYCMRNEGFDVAMEKSSFCLERSSNGELMLKKEHPYYYQCQLQMVATARPYCDFVVWRPEDCHIERVFHDRDFIAEKLKKGEELFWLGIVPELLGKWFTRDNSKLSVISQAALDEDDEDDDGTWCYCKEAKGVT